MDRHRPFRHPRERREGDVLAFVDDVLVDIVREGDDIELLAQVGHELQLLAREHLARRVMRRVDDDASGLLVERGAKLHGIDGPVGLVEGHVARDRVGPDRVGSVVLVERLEDDDLVARVQEAEHRRDHRLGGTAGDGDLGLGVDLLPAREVARGDGGDGIPERLGAPGDGVLVDVRVDRIGDRSLELRRAGEVGEPLGQADGTGRDRQPVHLADDRFGESIGLGGDPSTGCHGREV